MSVIVVGGAWRFSCKLLWLNVYLFLSLIGPQAGLWWGRRPTAAQVSLRVNGEVIQQEVSGA